MDIRSKISTLHKIGFWGLIACYCLWVMQPVYNHDETPMLIENMANEKVLPRLFRMSTDPLPNTAAKKPSTVGLAALNISGSSQFSVDSLSAILEKIPSKKVMLVDLRQESHGFINGAGVSWYTTHDWMNIGKTLEQIEANEEIRLDDVRLQGWVYIYKRKFIPILTRVKEVLQEKQLAAKNSLGYFRLPITDHKKPTDHDVDRFLAFVKELTPDAWIHFHCAAGIGRTTTFMVMYDMMRNHDKVSAEDIIKRQALLGGLDLLAPIPQTDWKAPYLLEREQFIADFFLYCQDVPDFSKTWTEWLNQK